MPSGNTSLDLKRPARGIASRHMLKLFFYTSLDYPVCNSAIRRRLHALFPRVQFCNPPETSYFVSPCAVLQSAGDFMFYFPVRKFCDPQKTLCFISPCAIDPQETLCFGQIYDCPASEIDARNSSSVITGIPSSLAFLFFPDEEAASLLIRAVVFLETDPATLPPRSAI